MTKEQVLSLIQWMNGHSGECTSQEVWGFEGADQHEVDAFFDSLDGVTHWNQTSVAGEKKCIDAVQDHYESMVSKELTESWVQEHVGPGGVVEYTKLANMPEGTVKPGGTKTSVDFSTVPILGQEETPAPEGTVPFNSRPDYDAIPPIVLVEYVLALRDGDSKYGRKNYLSDLRKVSSVLSGVFSHILKWQCGQERDEESGAHHLGMAIGRLGMIIAGQAHGTVIDDRVPNEVTLQRIKEIKDGLE